MRQPDPEALEYLKSLSRVASTPFPRLPVDEARAQMKRLAAARPPEKVGDVRDVSIEGPAGKIGARLYRPEAAAERLPIVVAFHGGSFYLGDLDTFDAACRRLTRLAGCITISIDYRRAPEHPYPAAAEDCFAATRWAARYAPTLGGDARAVAVYGSSAGGNLAAATALMARDRGGPPLACQVLVVPMLDARLDTASCRECGDGYGVSLEDFAIGWSRYLPSAAQADEPYACPLRAERLAGVAPAIVVTAGFDPLRDEGDVYAARLSAEGVEVAHLRYPGMLHGFRGAKADEEVATALKAAFDRALRGRG